MCVLIWLFSLSTGGAFILLLHDNVRHHITVLIKQWGAFIPLLHDISTGGAFILLLHDTERPHTAVLIKHWWSISNWSYLIHSYSPDLAPSNYCLFTHLKNWLGSRHFNSKEYLMEGVKMWLSSHAADFSDTGTLEFTPWYKCLNSGNDYVGKLLKHACIFLYIKIFFSSFVLLTATRCYFHYNSGIYF
jgi:hypothetical protein